MEQQEQQFIKGFNDGYLLAKHEPEIAAQLAKTPNESNGYFSGLIGGKDQYELEVREWSKGLSRGTSRNQKDNELER